ncbi:MAG: uroporphyrinogen decarboxylase/cobalamine-independent methonine synthase family protein [Dehalococcoidia bacterium]
MSSKLEFEFLATAIGSMPDVNADEACSKVMEYLPDIPAWPQLPRRAPQENMVVQFSEGFPGAVMKGGKIHIEPSANFDSELEQIHIDCEEDNAHKYGVSSEYAAGLHAFLSKAAGSEIVKGQVTGPVTWGLSVTRQDGLGILYDETLAETAAKFLRLKAVWQENILKQISPNTVIFVDEPYLVSLGSVFTPVPEEKVPALLKEVFGGIKGTKGIHCCGNTDWSVLLDTEIDILSFDAYNYASSLSTHSDKVKSFFERGGNIAWGIVPNDEEALAGESLSSLRDRLEETIAPFTRDGIRFKQVIAQGLVTPSCGLGTLSPEAAGQALELTARLSRDLRSRYVA